MRLGLNFEMADLSFSLGQPDGRSGERQKVNSEGSLGAPAARWWAEVNVVILFLMIVLPGKGSAAAPADGKDRNCLLSRILRGREREERGCSASGADSSFSPGALFVCSKRS